MSDLGKMIIAKNAQISTLKAELADAKGENDKLRAILGNSNVDCVYCTLPRERWSECQDGFPGCVRSDDAMLCPHVGASLEAESALTIAQARIAELERALSQLLFNAISDAHGMTVAHEMSFNGWRWPEDIRYVNETHEQCRSALASTKEVRGP